MGAYLRSEKRENVPDCLVRSISGVMPNTKWALYCRTKRWMASSIVGGFPSQAKRGTPSRTSTTCWPSL